VSGSRSAIGGRAGERELALPKDECDFGRNDTFLTNPHAVLVMIGYAVVLGLSGSRPREALMLLMVLVVELSCRPASGPGQTGVDFSSRVTAIIAPPTTAGIPPPGCTDAPTRHSQGRQGSL
jgi:hypothetical protein